VRAIVSSGSKSFHFWKHFRLLWCKIYESCIVSGNKTDSNNMKLRSKRLLTMYPEYISFLFLYFYLFVSIVSFFKLLTKWSIFKTFSPFAILIFHQLNYFIEDYYAMMFNKVPLRNASNQSAYGE